MSTDHVRLIRRTEFCRRAGFSRVTEYRLSKKDPTFPKPVQISPGLTGYREDEANAWLEARPRVARDDAQAP